MAKFLYNMEKKFGRFAIPNLPLVMILLYATGYIMELISPVLMYKLSLNPYEIINHLEIWRVFTWVIIPPDSDNIFYMLLSLYFYYSIGNAMEKTWGKFLFNLYTFSGLLFVLIGSFVAYGFLSVAAPYLATQGNMMLISYMFFTSYYVNMSIFLAFAATYPEAQIYLFMILPVKVKVLGYIYAIIMFYEAFRTILRASFELGLVQLFMVCMALFNFAIFFFTTRSLLKTARVYVRSTAQKARTAAPKMKPENKVAKHRCAICGQTSDDNPDLSFRFCSKCNGNYEYCQEHLFTHVHKY